MLCFVCKVGDHDKVRVTKICCSSCSRTFDRLVKRYAKVNACAVPMVWREPRSHLDDWYFGITNTNSFSGKCEHKIEYPNTPSALRPVPRDDSMPVPEPPENYTLDSETESEEASLEAGPIKIFQDTVPQSHLITQAEMNELVRDWTSLQPRLSYLDHGLSSGTFYKRA